MKTLLLQVELLCNELFDKGSQNYSISNVLLNQGFLQNVCLGFPHTNRVTDHLEQWFLTGGCKEISMGARPLTCSTTWNAFERECVSSKRYASANFTPLHVIWFSSGRDGSQG